MNTITNDQIKEAYERPELLKELFPDAFKPVLEVGKWYKHKELDYIFCFNGVYDDYSQYGFNRNGDWKTCFSVCKRNLPYFIPATTEEVEKALINEAVKRGFKKGVKYVPISQIGKLNETYYVVAHEVVKDKDSFQLYCGFQWIFVNGKWAEIIQETELELTLDQIAEKFGVDKVKIKK